jgi:cytochrome c-L
MLSNKVGKATLFVPMLALVGVFALPLQASAECPLESSHAGHALLNIKVTDKDTPESKIFLETCKNPYTKMYVADPELAKAGRKQFNLYSCNACHGGQGEGLVAVSITDDKWVLSKHVTDKGLFENIAGGSDGGMPGWHQQVMGNPDLMSTDDILKAIGWIRMMYKGGTERPWLNE